VIWKQNSITCLPRIYFEQLAVKPNDNIVAYTFYFLVCLFTLPEPDLYYINRVAILKSYVGKQNQSLKQEISYIQSHSGMYNFNSTS
jgi:hypothetical protein